jgi:hypothetical protein
VLAVAVLTVLQVVHFRLEAVLRNAQRSEDVAVSVEMLLDVVADEVVPTEVKVGPSNRLQFLAAELRLQRLRSLRVSPCVVRLQKRRCQGQVLLLPPVLQTH